MAFLDLTAINALQEDSMVQKEMRMLNHGLIDFAKWMDQGASWLTPEMRSKLSTLVNNTFQLPALVEDVITTADVESFDIPINSSESAVVTATKVTIFSGYKLNPYQLASNLITPDEYKRNKRLEIFKAMAKKKEELIQTFLETQKTQVLDVTGVPTGYSFNTGTDELEITLAAQGDIMFATLDTIMKQNNLNNPNAVAGTYGLQHVLNEWMKYGANNDKNLQNQNMPVDVFLSNQVTNSQRFTGYVGQWGGMAMVENYLPEFIDNVTVDNAAWGLTDGAVPFLNERVMVYQNKGKANATSPGTTSPENIMSIYEEEAFISKFYFIEKFNSDLTSRVADIVRIEGQTT